MSKWRQMAKWRRAIVTDEYLDGTMGMFVRDPTEDDEMYQLLPSALLDRLERANKEVVLAEAELRQAMAKAIHIENPDYVPELPPTEKANG